MEMMKPHQGLLFFFGSLATSVTLSLARSGRLHGSATRLFGRAVKVPPVAKKLPVTVYFGKDPTQQDQFRGDGAMDPPIQRSDDYFWMRDETRTNNEVLNHIKAENAYAEFKMEPLKDLQEKVYQSMLSRLKETDEDVPYPYGNFEYYSRTVEGKAYKIHCRKPRKNGGKEQVILDENALAEGHEYSVVSDHKISPCGKFLAYSVDHTGDEHYLLQIKDTATGALLADNVDEISGTIVWGKDATMLFYTKLDDESRPFELYVHVVGTAASEDILLHREDDQLFWMDISKTCNDRYLVMDVSSKETGECHYIDLLSLTIEELQLKKSKVLQVVEKRLFGVRYEIEAQGDKFLIITNKDSATCNKLCVAPCATPGAANWKDVKSYDPKVQLDSVTPFRDFVAIFGRMDGLEKVWIAKAKQLSLWSALSFDESCYTVYEGDNAEYDSDRLRLVYSSLITPKRVFDYVFADKSIVLLKEQEVTNYSKELYTTCRIEVPARDGVSIPVSLVFKTSLLSDPSKPGVLKFDGPQKLLLYGYGSYGACIDPGFDFKKITLLDSDIVYAIAHIRGGGEMGRPWYEEQGKYLTKLNTFNDFADVAKELTARGMTNASKMACVGRSAGGLLVGAVLNRDGNLFKAAVADVPFVDVINSMSDPSIPLTVTEWEEWGNPNLARFHEYMKAYSPYDNVESKSYPSILVTAGLHDHRVAYWEPLKWVAKLRALKTDSNPLLLKTDLAAGHFSASDRYKYLRETAFEYAFIINELST